MALREGEQGTEQRRSILRRVLPPFAAIRAFEAVGHLGGIRRAALELGVDHAAVSRHLRALETWAGVRLFDRERGGLLTEEGQKYHARISSALEEISRASIDLTRRGDDTKLTIWCVPGLASRWLNGRLADFAGANPQIDIEVRPSDQPPDLSRHEADADIRYLRDFTACSEEAIQTIEIARIDIHALASPALAERFPGPLKAAHLLDLPLLHEHEDYEWRRWFAAHGVEAPARLAGPRLWHAHLTLDAARRGQGIVLTNRFLVGDDLTSGALVKLPIEDAVDGLSFGSYVLRVRRDRWRNPGILRLRRWLEKEVQQVDR